MGQSTRLNDLRQSHSQLGAKLHFRCVSDGQTKGFAELSEETQPLVYGARLITFGLIIIAIIRKNRPSRG